MKNKGFENGNVVPIVSGKVQSFWPTIPNIERQRDLRVYHVLNTGMGDSAMKTYLEAHWTEELHRRKHIIAKQQARLADLT